MRRLAVLVLVLPAIALAAQVRRGPAHPTAVPIPPPASAKSGSRTVSLLSPAAPAPVALGDSAACSTACAQTNFFCQASQAPDDCSAAWSRCVAACALPNLGPAASPKP